MSKQSSVEWLISQLQKSKDWQRVLNEVSQMSTARIDIIGQAKAMHKEEMISSYKNAMASAYFNTHNWMPQEGYIHKAEQYYNEIFGGQDNE